MPLFPVSPRKISVRNPARKILFSAPLPSPPDSSPEKNGNFPVKGIRESSLFCINTDRDDCYQLQISPFHWNIDSNLELKVKFVASALNPVTDLGQSEFVIPVFSVFLWNLPSVGLSRSPFPSVKTVHSDTFAVGDPSGKILTFRTVF